MIISYSNYCLARDVWEEFSLRQHSKHIATLSALACLAQILSEHKPKRVVELGGGIGTMTELMARHTNAPPLLVTLEDSPICLPSLERVIRYSGPHTNSGLASHPTWKIAKSAAELTGLTPDLLLVDGGDMSPPELSVIRPGCMVFCEGNRVLERHFIETHCFAAGWKITFANELLYRLDQPVPEKSCWIGTVV